MDVQHTASTPDRARRTATSFERSAIVIAAGMAVLALASIVGKGVGPVTIAGQITDGGPIGFFVAAGDPRTGYRDTDRQLASWAFESWVRHSDGALHMQPAAEAEATVRLYWAPLDGGTFGEMRPIVVAGRRGAAVYVRADVNSLDPDLAARARADNLWRDTIVYLTCLHELGHALGLAHTADERDIMYFFGYGGDIIEYFGRYRRQLATRADIVSASGLSESDIRRLQTLHPHH